ncbi:ArsR/SmtB family transcription factor [Corynebacterium capitovis]|uniref:ArsR/SmtB family transcription factor n=1 Tax=Corynebacterium capitovis TaxID=131081 RepID=UPI00036E7736|nr:metalloregulator ArsR/SmtB family transcription factor [Corynebacterium capitovis]
MREEYTPDDVRRIADVVSALDSPLRLHIVLILSTGDYVVHQLVDQLNKSQPLISQHLRVLKRAGLVSSTRTGREVKYNLVKPAVVEAIRYLASVSDVPPSVVELASRRPPVPLPPFSPAADHGQAPGSAAAIIDPPSTTRPEIDPGVRPNTVRPARD